MTDRALVEVLSGWELAIDGYDEERQRVHAALFSIAGCGVGVSGAPLLARGTAQRWLVVSGLYDGDGPGTELLVGPVLTDAAVVDADDRLRRVLDLQVGVLRESVTLEGSAVELIRFVSLARPGIIVVRTTSAHGVRRPPAGLVSSSDADRGRDGDISWMRVTGTHGGISAALVESGVATGVDDVVALAWDQNDAPDAGVVVARAREAQERGVDALMDEHRRAWMARWNHADIAIPGDPDLQTATRFAMFHLMSSVPEDREAAVGARGVTGTAYRGHVFWDADTFVLPFLAATHPPAARSMLAYRLNRLDAARRAARDAGRDGARFPWESALTGHDVTPASARDRTGTVIPVLTGTQEEHIVAQVAWAACQYIDWTGDQAFARGPGCELLVDTARYWASRIRIDEQGRGHIDGVIGPDEYHEAVDDNAFTNIMARWNLRRAADAAELDDAEVPGARPDEPERWRELAAALVDGYDERSGIYEQFRGFHDLEPLVIAEVAPRRPIAAELLLGLDRIRGTQVVKQADVVMLHHLVPDDVAPGSLEPNLRHYEPLTAHGSSLSPAIYAALFARSGHLERALGALHVAARIDLDDLTGTTAGGLHLATMGGLWQALVYGFAGIRPGAGELRLDPVVPAAWGQVTVNVRFHGAHVRMVAEPDRLEVTSSHPVSIALPDGHHPVGPGALAARRSTDGWERVG